MIFPVFIGFFIFRMQEVLAKLEGGLNQIDEINETAAVLLSSHLDSYVNNQLRHLNSRYQVLQFLCF